MYMLSNSDLRALFLGPDAPPKASAKRLRRDSSEISMFFVCGVQKCP